MREPNETGPVPPALGTQSLLLYGGGGGLFLAVLGVIAGWILLAFLGFLIAIVSVAGGLLYQHWTQEQQHRRELDRLRALNDPNRWTADSYVAGEHYKAEAAGMGGMMGWMQELLHDALGHKEQAREREHQADESAKQRDLQEREGAAERLTKRELAAMETETKRTMAEAERTGSYEQLITRLKHELDMLETRMKYDRPDAEVEVNQRMIKLKGRLAEAEHINGMEEGPQKEQAWRIWRNDI